MLACLLLIALLKICTSQEVCEDFNWKCVTWKRYCDDLDNKVYMEMNCRKTCGRCPKCEDNHFTCEMRKLYCNDPVNKNWMQKNCRLTCGICLPPVTTPRPSQPPTPTWKVIPAGECGISTAQTGRIINGVDAKKGAWPWQVLIRLMGDPHCGGSIINPFWIVTAGHCLKWKEPLMEHFSVITGEDNFNKESGTETSIGVSKIIVHEKFDSWTLDYDVALMKLKRPIPFSKYVATACLPDQNSTVPIGTKCFITGWGTTNRVDPHHEKLQQAMLPVTDIRTCRNLNAKQTGLDVTERMLCAGHGPSNPTNGCHGDSGGPFVCQSSNGRWYLQGSVSWGSARCNSSEAYTVFAKTSYFRGWIDEQIALY